MVLRLGDILAGSTEARTHGLLTFGGRRNVVDYTLLLDGALLQLFHLFIHLLLYRNLLLNLLFDQSDLLVRPSHILLDLGDLLLLLAVLNHLLAECPIFIFQFLDEIRLSFEHLGRLILVSFLVVLHNTDATPELLDLRLGVLLL